MMGFDDVPVAVRFSLAVKVSVYPAETLNVTPPDPTPCEFRAETADAMVE
jgi:hypothetical protein